MTHLTGDELAQWRDRGHAEDRDRVLGHLAACADCRRAFAALLRDTPDVSPSATDPQPFVARGVTAYRPERTWWRGRAAWISAGSLAAAALVFAVALLRPGALPDEDIAIRSSDVLAIAPAGDVPAVQEFRWASPFAAARYRLVVRDTAGQVVIDAKTAVEHFTVPLDLQTRLGPGSYTWTVEALDQAGGVLGASTPQPFAIRR